MRIGGLHIADWITLLVYLTGITALGMWMSKSVHNATDSFVGGRRRGKWLQTVFTFGAGAHPDQPFGVAAKTFISGKVSSELAITMTFTLGANMADDNASDKPARITAEHKVAQIVEWYPAAIEVLKRHGFTQIVNPIMRRTVAKRVSIAQAAEMKGVDLDKLLTDLNAVIGESRNSY